MVMAVLSWVSYIHLYIMILLEITPLWDLTVSSYDFDKPHVVLIHTAIPY